VNLLIFEAREVNAEGQLVLGGRRLGHIIRILKLQPGDTLRIGELGGQIGSGTVLSIDQTQATVAVSLDSSPPAAMPLSLVLALPRPKMLRRILRGISELGVKDIHLINSYRVEKSYWQSPLLSPEGVREALINGLEQSMDTLLPTVSLHRRFRPFAEDVLPGLCGGREALLADPQFEEHYPERPATPALAIIGPEGGFIPFERNLLLAAGARGVNLGRRILRVETALHCVLGRHLAPSR
jgi:RsmE family RNA methyltransferase